MLRGVCLDSDGSSVLVKNKEYYLFPSGNAVYVSKFAKTGSHFGMFNPSRFKIVEEEEWPPEPVASFPELEPGVMYFARLVWRPKYYDCTELKPYYLVPKKTHANFYGDQNKKKFHGCYPLNWFNDFVPVEIVPVLETIEIPDEPLLELEPEIEPDFFGQLSLDLF